MTEKTADDLDDGIFYKDCDGIVKTLFPGEVSEYAGVLEVSLNNAAYHILLSLDGRSSLLKDTGIESFDDIEFRVNLGAPGGEALKLFILLRDRTKK